MPSLTDQQQKAVESIDKNVLVSAGAGSGKTMVLVERYIEVLRNHEDATISDIIAVTFTRKAAEEMRSRLKLRLKQISAETQGQAKKRWSKLLADVDRARIGTIHSLCESVLKSFPAEAGIDPQFELLDDLSRAELISESVEESLQSIFAEPTEEQLALLEFPVDHIRNWVLDQLKSVPQYRSARSVFGEDFELLEEHADSVLKRVQAHGLRALLTASPLAACADFMEQNPFADPKSALEQRRIEALSWLRQVLAAGTPSGPTIQDTMGLMRTLAEMANLGTAGGATGKPLRDAISQTRKCAREFVEGYPAALNEADRAAFPLMRALLSLVDNAIARYEQLKQACQKVDYNDLIARTHELVCRENSPARKHYAERLKAILVDEFQDTNHTQAQLLSALCGSTSRLFLIGDDKQSIYKFQGADVSTFNEWKALIASGCHGLDGDGLLLDLSYSFRSHPNIVNFVNQFFRLHFGTDSPDEPAHRARHQSLIPSRTDDSDASRVELVVYDATGEEEKREAEKAKGLESRAIAAWIWEKITSGTIIHDKELGHDRPIAFGDFAVLVPTNNDFGSIESALAEAAIPYVTFAGTGFLNRQEIFDIENMLRWFKCTDDSFALLAVLRSPFFGINDGVIHKVDHDFDGPLWNAIQRASKNSEFEVLRRPVALLRQLLEDSQKLTLGELVRSIIATTSYDVVLLSLPNGKQKSRNAWKMATFVRDHNHLTIAEFLAALDAMRDLGAGKQTDAPLSSTNSVKLMTIHKSKGLEFPAVVLPVMGRKINQVNGKLLVHREFGAALDTTRSKDEEKPAFFQACSTLNADLEQEERKRLLYVAMTRARDFLGIFFERYAKNEQSFRLWIKNAVGMDCDDQSTRRASLVEKEHYTTRYLDEASINEWQLSHAGFIGKYLSTDELENLANESGFDLISPLIEQQYASAAKAPQSRLARVTATASEGSLDSRVIGNFFHLLMQLVAVHTEKPDQAMLERIAGTAEVNVAHGAGRERLLAEGERLLDKFYLSPLYDLLKNARRVMQEVSYMIVSDTNCIDRRPDLIFQDQDGQWQIVDYKTDKLTSSQLAAKMNEHSAQVLEYVRDFAQIAGTQARGWIYFAELGTLEEVQSAGYAVAKSGQLQLPLPT